VPRFLVDENLPRSLARHLRDSGFEVRDVREVGLRGRLDDEVFAYAQSSSLTLVTGDVGFGNIFRYPLGKHCGIVVVRLPNEFPARVITSHVVGALRTLSSENLDGALVVLESDRIRIRRRSE
jgi:predicted nuclease of predicted toxin-antitoxin system